MKIIADGSFEAICQQNPSDDEDFDEDSDIWGEDDNDDDEAINNYLSNETTCWGCKENQPNQLAHMDKGGCLYFANTDDEDSEEEREQYAVNTLMDEMDIGDDGDDDDEIISLSLTKTLSILFVK